MSDRAAVRQATETPGPVVEHDRPRGRKPRLDSQSWAGMAVVAPFGVLMLAFLVLPLAYALKISLYRESLLVGSVFAWFDIYTAAV